MQMRLVFDSLRHVVWDSSAVGGKPQAAPPSFSAVIAAYIG